MEKKLIGFFEDLNLIKKFELLGFDWGLDDEVNGVYWVENIFKEGLDLLGVYVCLEECEREGLDFINLVWGERDFNLEEGLEFINGLIREEGEKSL